MIPGGPTLPDTTLIHERPLWRRSEKSAPCVDRTHMHIEQCRAAGYANGYDRGQLDALNDITPKLTEHLWRCGGTCFQTAPRFSETWAEFAECSG